MVGSRTAQDRKFPGRSVLFGVRAGYLELVVVNQILKERMAEAGFTQAELASGG